MTGVADDNTAVARGAALAFIGRLGALIEAVSIPVFAWAYGAATIGIYFALWSVIKVTTSLTEFGMTTALQRFVASAKSEEEAHATLKLALVLSTSFSVIIAFVLWLLQAPLASLFNASEADSVHLQDIIALYVWALPFWTFIEVSTAAIRARGTFGPEIRVRIFYEQGLRFVFGLGFYFAGILSFGLFYAHLLSLVAAAFLGLRLVSKHYDMRLLMRVPIRRDRLIRLLRFSTPMAPANLIKKLNSEMPVFLLNILLPGAAGATASGLYGTARKIVSALQVVRLSFEYVMAPLASAKDHRTESRELEEMFAFATRLICGVVLPAAAFLVLARHDFLALFKPEFAGASIVILILAGGRTLEAVSGPASAIIEMKGHVLLPLTNGLAGVLTMTGLIFGLTADYGLAGAAIAAAVGLNVTSLLSLAEVQFVYGLSPYRLAMMRPILVGLTLAVGAVGISELSLRLGHAGHFVILLTTFLVSMAVLFRFGFAAADRAAFSKKPAI